MGTEYPRIVAVREGGDAYLVEVAKGRGVVYHGRPLRRSPEMDLDAFLKFGWWVEANGSLRLEDIVGMAGDI